VPQVLQELPLSWFMRRLLAFYKPRRNTLCTEASAARPRGHTQYIVQTAPITRLAAIQPKITSATVSMGAPPMSSLLFRNTKRFSRDLSSQ
jgi:hypothetical protein